jgi:hypothetical protein
MIKDKEKQFDCIKIKDSIQAQIYAETQNMSKDELLKYFNRNTQKNRSLNSDFVKETEAVYKTSDH